MFNVNVHINTKGGIGKTVSSACNAQCIKYELKQPVTCLNTDPVNDSFYDFKALEVIHIPIVDKDNKIDRKQFDRMIELIVSTESHFVIDSGSSSFVPLLEFLAINNIVELLNAHGRSVTFHIPITGGPAQKDTIKGLNGILKNLPDSAHYIIWENRHFGEIRHNSKGLQSLAILQEYENKIDSIITFGDICPYSTPDFTKMIKNKHTFMEATDKQSEDYNMMEKFRLSQTQKKLFSQIKDSLTTIGFGEE